MFRPRSITGKSVGVATALVLAFSTLAAMAASSSLPTPQDDSGFPVISVSAAQIAAAQSDADQNFQRFDEATLGVDPIVTGPVSAKFKQQSLAAGCDEAVWPNIPSVCYPK